MNSEVILATGAAGIQLLPLSVLKEYGKQCKIVGDINALPPLGIEGLKLTGDRAEVIPVILGIEAVVIGSLKLKIEGELFKNTVETPKGIYDYNVAYEVAKEIAMTEIKEG